MWGSWRCNGCSAWRASGTAKAVTHVPQVYLGNRDRLDGSYVCPNHKQELSSVYQFIDVLYNLRWVLSSSGERLMEFCDPLVSSDSLSDFVKSDSNSVCTVLCNALSTHRT